MKLPWKREAMQSGRNVPAIQTSLFISSSGQTTQRHIPEYSRLHSQYRKNFKYPLLCPYIV